MTRTELMDELLDFYRAAHESLLATEARLTRKVASLQRKLADADETGHQAACVRDDLRVELRVALHEIERLRLGLPISPKYEDRSLIGEQAQALGQANKDRDAWAARCENAENLLRGYFQGVGSTDPSKAEELKQRTRLHFRGIGEGT